MKKGLALCLALLLVAGMLPLPARAAQTQEVICFEDGSYIVVGPIESSTRASGSRTASKPYTYYDSDGVAKWKATLTGSFTYNGSSATCTSASMDVSIYNSSWYTYSKNASKSGNTANGSATMGWRVDGSTVTKKSASLSLTCDANGNVS